MTRVVHHLKSNAIAYLALFIALGGTSYAAIRLPANSVGNRALKNHSVSAIKLDRSSIAGYVRDWARIDSNGRVTASRPKARLIGWTETGPAPGGLIQWSRPVPAACIAIATTEILPRIGLIRKRSGRRAGAPSMAARPTSCFRRRSVPLT